MEHKNFGLTETSFKKMVNGLKHNDTDFFKRVFLKQFKETVAYIKRRYGANQEDAYDATMDALLEFRRRFVEGKLKYGNLRFLFTQMSAQMFLRNKKIQEPVLSDGVMALEPVEEETTPGVPESFKEAWKKLGGNCKQLLTQHYYGAMQLTEIAQEMSKAPATVRKQKERCIAKLKEEMLKFL